MVAAWAIWITSRYSGVWQKAASEGRPWPLGVGPPQMSEIGTKRTFSERWGRAAFTSKTDIPRAALRVQAIATVVKSRSCKSRRLRVQDLDLHLPNPGRFKRTSGGDSRRLAGVGKGGSAPPLPTQVAFAFPRMLFDQVVILIILRITHFFTFLFGCSIAYSCRIINCKKLIESEQLSFWLFGVVSL